MSIADLRRKPRGWAKTAIAKTVALRRHRIQETVVIAGHPRSGTTWLADLCAVAAGTSILFEPLCPVSVRAARTIDAELGTDRPQPACRPPVERASKERGDVAETEPFYTR